MADARLSDATTPARIRELAVGLAAVRSRIEAACRTVSRDTSEVTLVVVTKTWPAADVAALHGLGARDIAENRAQELVAKARELRALGVTWHFVGQLQTNKAAAVAGSVDVVHSLDRPKLVTTLGRAAHDAGRVVRGLVQVRLDDPSAGSGRGGADDGDVVALSDLVAATEGLVLAGVMGVAPMGTDPGPAFARLQQAADAVRRAHPQADWLSAGMSGDLEAAVAHGATHVRVGSAILGSRPAPG